jgi:aminoglycoside phosphotransferase (APT) family kinase protein
MGLPVFPEVTIQILEQISDRHGFHTRQYSSLPSIGVFNAIYLLGDELVLRVPRNHPHFVSAITKESIAVPEVSKLGIKTPALVVYDDSCDVLPVPYAIFERVHGMSLHSLRSDSPPLLPNYVELGRELALLHSGVEKSGQISSLGEPNLPMGDAVSLVDELAKEGFFTVNDTKWLQEWLAKLPPLLSDEQSRRFLHGDTQATNIFIDPTTFDYLAIIDWGGCGWGDPALDFSGMPLRFVPAVLNGYREIAALPEDLTAEGRILRYHLFFALINLRNNPQPLRSWGERPLSYFLEVMYCLRDPGFRGWQQWF